MKSKIIGILLLILLLFSIGISCSSADDGYVVRKVKWGYTKNQVIEAEGSNGKENPYLPGWMRYEVKLEGKPASLKYFIDGIYGLSEIEYILEFKDSDEAVKVAETIAGRLIGKYGKPDLKEDRNYTWNLKDKLIFASINEYAHSLSYFVNITYLMKTDGESEL